MTANQTCPKCSNINRPEAKFCDQCGVRLEIEDPEQIYYSKFIRLQDGTYFEGMVRTFTPDAIGIPLTPGQVFFIGGYRSADQRKPERNLVSWQRATYDGIGQDEGPVTITISLW